MTSHLFFSQIQPGLSCHIFFLFLKKKTGILAFSDLIVSVCLLINEDTRKTQGRRCVFLTVVGFFFNIRSPTTLEVRTGICVPRNTKLNCALFIFFIYQEKETMYLVFQHFPCRKLPKESFS